MEEALNGLECPFTWNIPECTYYDGLMKKLDKIRDQSSFLINGFCIMILDCFEKARGDRVESALPIAKECELMLSEYLPVGLFAAEEKYLWERCSDAMWHVLHSTQAHLAYRNDDLQTTEKILEKITPASCFNNNNLAAILGLKSRMLIEYGPHVTTMMAIEFLREAIQLDNSVPLWHFLLGKGLARSRRADRSLDKPCAEELSELERAWTESRRAEYGVMLLHSYQNCLSGNRNLVDKTKRKMDELFRDVQDMAGTEWYIYARLAHIGMRLPWLSSRENMKKLIDLAHLHCKTAMDGLSEDNIFLACISCQFYKRFEKDFDKTLKYALRAAQHGGSIGCALDTISMRYQMNKSMDLTPLFDTFLDLFKTKFHNEWQRLSINKANYLLYNKRNIEEAFKIYFEIMEDSRGDDEFLKNFRPLLGEAPFNCSYSIYDKLKNELRQAIRSSTNKQNMMMFEEYLQKLNTFDPDRNGGETFKGSNT